MLGLGVPNHTFTRLGQLILVGHKKEQEQIMLIILFCTIVLLCIITEKRIIKQNTFVRYGIPTLEGYPHTTITHILWRISQKIIAQFS